MIITTETTIEAEKIHFIMGVINTMVILMVIPMEIPMAITVIAIGITNQNQDILTQDIQNLGITGKVEQGSTLNFGIVEVVGIFELLMEFLNKVKSW